MRSFKLFLLLNLLIFFPVTGISQHTFSIVAVDSITGEIGSAGATCLNQEDGALGISDIILSKGAIHTQAWWNPKNQKAARVRMEAGDSPQEIITWLVQNDDGTDGRNKNYRQYGIIDLNDGHPRVAAYTGHYASNVKNHILGPNYAIQGNILLEQAVLTDMETAFINETGSLADKLMAAMQGAKRVGADSRCSSYGKSSLSAFVRVAQSTDTNSFYGNLSLDLNVWATPAGIDPIDSLQNVYDKWKVTSLKEITNSPNSFFIYQNFPNPFNSITTIRYQLSVASKLELNIYNVLGKKVQTLVNRRQQSGSYKVEWNANNFPSGIYLCRLVTEKGFSQSRKFILLK